MLRETRLYRRKENGVLQEHLGQDTRHDQDQRAADARCDLSKGQKLHALCRRQHGDVARAAHVRGAKTGGNGGFDGVETDEVAADGYADHDDQNEQHVKRGECADDGAEVDHGDADADQQGARPVLHNELAPLLRGFLKLLRDEAECLGQRDQNDHPRIGVDSRNNLAHHNAQNVEEGGKHEHALSAFLVDLGID